MAIQRQRPLRRAGLVLTGSLIGHLAVLYLAATALFVPHRPPMEFSQVATPVEMVPRPRPAPPKSPRRPRRDRPQVQEPPTAQAQAFPTIIPEPPAGAPGGGSASAQGGEAAAPPAQPPGPPVVQIPPAPTYPINPGYWEVVERWLVIRKTERYCVAPENISRFMAAPCNHIYNCAYPVQSIEDDKLRFEGVIWKRDERYDVHGSGAYSPTELHVNLHGRGHWHLLPIVFGGSLDGRFLGADCPPDAKRIRQR